MDVDGHAKKKKWGATIYPNLALGKLARYHKEVLHDEVEWASPLSTYDIVYQSKIFNFTPSDETCYNTQRIIRGGTGYCINSESTPKPYANIEYSVCLPHRIDHMQPDYSIFPLLPKDTAYGFLTRGCPNRCKWCVVPRKEGPIVKYMDIEEIAIEGRKKVVLMDNNILAAGDYAMEQLDKIINRGYRVDFNQALDARLVTDDYAKLLAQVKWLDNNRIRFGCDTHKQIEDCERAMELIKSYGFKGEFFLYTMLNDNFQECYERVVYWWRILQHTRHNHLGNRVYAYAQPYRDPDNPNRLIPQWQKDMAGWVNKKAHFVAHSFEDFQPRQGFKCSEYFHDKQKR